MDASTSNYSQPSKKNDWIVLSYDGYSSYVLVIDEASRYTWVFLTTSKELMDTSTVGKFARIKVESWPACLLCWTQSSGRIDM